MSHPENTEDRLQIAERLRSAREYLGISQAEIAQLVGLTRTAITGIESGARRVEATELKRLASIYRRSVEYLLTGCEPPYNGPEQFAFLARAVNGLTQKDVDEVARFAEFLRASKAN